MRGDGGVITVSAVVLRDDAGRILTVRKRGTTRFMLPGGKPEPGESAAACAIREILEEVGAALDPARCEPLGIFRAAAANEAGFDVDGAVFTHPPVVEVGAAAEIAELRWLDVSRPLPEDLAPLLEHGVLPALAAQRRSLPARVAMHTGSALGTRPGAVAGVRALTADLTRLGLELTVGEDLGALIDGSADAFVALPGGAATAEELREIWNRLRPSVHVKPVALYDVESAWGPLPAMLDRMVAEGSLDTAFRDSLIVASSPAELQAGWRAWDPPAPTPSAPAPH